MREPTTELTRPRRELARRAGGGIEVTLYWSAHDNSTSIDVWQSASDETLHFTVARAAALDAFYHPFAHLHCEEQNLASAPHRKPDSLPFELRAEP